jgi:NAD(P)-dependent dehydrogenase (short-subunit alcohol dehydrogenase family)
MRRDLAGATVVATGASGGIGRATARAFAQAGASAVLAAGREHGAGA